MANTTDTSGIAPQTPVQVYLAGDDGQSRWLSNYRFIADHGAGGVEVQEWIRGAVSRFLPPDQVRVFPNPRVCYSTEWSERALDQVSFGVKDSKGRELGIQFRTWTAVIVEGPIQIEHSTYKNMCHGDRTPGVYYMVNGHTTRGGVTYGASTNDVSFTSEAERAAYIAKRTAAARKNGAKLAAGR